MERLESGEGGTPCRMSTSPLEDKSVRSAFVGCSQLKKELVRPLWCQLFASPSSECSVNGGAADDIMRSCSEDRSSLAKRHGTASLGAEEVRIAILPITCQIAGQKSSSVPEGRRDVGDLARRIVSMVGLER